MRKCTKCKKKWAVFNWPTEIIALFCKLCMVKGMIDLVHPKCADENCGKNPTFNFKGKKPMYCKKCAKPGMEDVVHPMCKHEGCEKQAHFGKKGKKREWCGKHKPEGAQDGNVKCKTCGKEAIFGNPLTMVPEYCSEHKLDDMVDVHSKLCEHDQCTVRASFGFNGKKQFCGKHQLKGMVQIGKPTCLKCSKQPVFNIPGEKKGLYCFDHQKPGMKNVVSKRCEAKDCEKQPNFNYPDQKRGVRCAAHAEEDMVDVKRTKCKSCCATAIFGKTEKSRASVCEKHFIEDYVNVVKAKQCSRCLANYEVIVDGVKFCFDHCPDKDYEVAVKRICRYCDAREDVAHVCVSCSHRQHIKEYAVVRHLRKTIEQPFIHDKIIADQECSRKRPDVYFDLPDRVVIVEIDEHQHKTYDEGCSCARMCEIVAAIGGRSVVFIRYNPDSCKWKGKAFKVHPAERIDLLVNVVKDEIAREISGFEVKLMQLWYDDDLEEYTPCKIEDITHLVAI